MANCVQCGKNVGCGCNLNSQGLCLNCSSLNSPLSDNVTNAINPDVSGFDAILNTPNLTQQEKLDRINAIIKAGQ